MASELADPTAPDAPDRDPRFQIAVQRNRALVLTLFADVARRARRRARGGTKEAHA
jgi:hypothetical protein